MQCWVDYIYHSPQQWTSPHELWRQILVLCSLLVLQTRTNSLHLSRIGAIQTTNRKDFELLLQTTLLQLDCGRLTALKCLLLARLNVVLVVGGGGGGVGGTCHMWRGMCTLHYCNLTGATVNQGNTKGKLLIIQLKCIVYPSRVSIQLEMVG